MKQSNASVGALALAGMLGAAAFAAAEEPSAPPSAEVHEPRPGPWKTAALYLPNRLLDLLDVAKLNVSVGRGTAGELRLTRLLGAGFSDVDVVRIGLNNRRSPILREKRDEGSLSLFGVTSGADTRDSFEIGGAVHFLILGLEAAGNLRSLADFALGFALVDLEKDDLQREEADEASGRSG